MKKRLIIKAIAGAAALSAAGVLMAGAVSVARAETAEASGDAAAKEAAQEEVMAAEREDSPEWVGALEQAQDAEQLFVVAGIGETTAYVSMHEKDADGNWKQIMTTPGYIGKKGLGKTKEGDAKTPVGTFRFNYAFGIAEDPGCALEYHQVDDNAYWSGDQRDGYHYNEMVDINEYPDLAVDDSEHIVDYTYQYQYCLNISYNEEGTPGLGSAIFLHCLGPIKPYTGGCVAIPQDQMITVMQNVREDCVVVIDSLEKLSPETWESYDLAAAESAADAELPTWPDEAGRMPSTVIYLYEDGTYSSFSIQKAEMMEFDVPEEYQDEVILKTEADAGGDGLFAAVYEKASVEAAKAQAEGGAAEDTGAGWLFSLGTIDEARFQEMLCGDMSGADVFARNEKGEYFVFYHPTDVRVVREDNNYDDASMESWTKLNEWAATVPDTFIQENAGLTPVTYDNSDVSIMLNRAAYDPDTAYTVSTTQYGPLEAAGVDPVPFVERITRNAKIEYADMEEGPDGEYVVLNFPEEGVRYDFFLMEGQGNVIRRVYEETEDEMYYTATFEDGETTASQIMQEWYDELAKANGKE